MPGVVRVVRRCLDAGIRRHRLRNLPSTLEALDDDWLGDWNAVTTLWVFNPEMEISDKAFRPEQLADLVIYGIEGSTAEAFALANGVEYRSLSAGTPMPSTETLVSIYREVYELD